MEKEGIVWVFIVTAILTGAAKAATDEQKAEQFEQIEQYIARRQQQIEDHYAGRLVELQMKTEAEIRLLEVADRGVFSTLAEQTKIAKAVLQIDGIENMPFGFFEPDESLDDILNSHFHETFKKAPRFFAIAQSRIAEAKSDILADFEWLALDIKKQKRYALAVRLPELEKKLKDNILAPKPTPTHGVITAIVYSREKPSAIIDGQIIHETDIIEGVRVVKIYPDKIKFEKKGKSWKQQVQETQKKYW